MKAERDFLVQKLKDAGIHGKIHESMKSLRNCNEVHVGAVLRAGEKFTRSGSKKIYTDQSGQRIQRKKLFERASMLHVVIGDANEAKVEAVLSAFLETISKGFAVDGNWVDIEVGEADWVDEDDSILKSKIAVEFDVTLRGGIYADVGMSPAKIGAVEAGKV